VNPSVLAIHGAVANGAAWQGLERALRGDVAVDAPDLPGHGARRGEPFSLAGAVEELRARARALAARGPLLVAGDSLGGYLALAVAAGLDVPLLGVLAGGCTYELRGAGGAAARLTLIADALARLDGKRAAERFFAGVVRREAGPEIGDAIVARGLNVAMRGLTLRALLGHDTLADVRALGAPVIFINGARDLPIVWQTKRFAAAARRGRALVVPGAGHGVGLLRPEAFAAALRSLLG
jgi:pimeloyl-ACP methyl ester carboxylesterase